MATCGVPHVALTTMRRLPYTKCGMYVQYLHRSQHLRMLYCVKMGCSHRGFASAYMRGSAGSRTAFILLFLMQSRPWNDNTGNSIQDRRLHRHRHRHRLPASPMHGPLLFSLSISPPSPLSVLSAAHVLARSSLFPSLSERIW